MQSPLPQKDFWQNLKKKKNIPMTLISKAWKLLPEEDRREPINKVRILGTW